MATQPTSTQTVRFRSTTAVITGSAVLVAVMVMVAILLAGPAADAPGRAQPTTPLANLAGVGGMPNPAPRPPQQAQARIPLANLAGMGGLPNPAPRDR